MTALTIHDIRRRALASLVPPPRLKLSASIEQNIRLPEGVSALAGAVRLWPYARDRRCCAPRARRRLGVKEKPGPLFGPGLETSSSIRRSPVQITESVIRGNHPTAYARRIQLRPPFDLTANRSDALGTC
jgi:hypothetical protein